MTTVDDLPKAYIERSGAPTVLVIEDDMTTVKLIKFTAEHLGWTILPVISIDELSALEHMDNFDLILSDDNINGGDINDTMAVLKKLNCKTPMYVISAGEKEHLQSVVEQGCASGLNIKGYIQKPFQLTDLQVLFNKYKMT